MTSRAITAFLPAALLACAVDSARKAPEPPPPEADAAAFEPIADANPDAIATADLIDAAPAPTPDAVVESCAVPRVDRWSGTARRDTETHYPDHIVATVAWERSGGDGCVDTYTPSGEAVYQYAIPGALCTQSITPDRHAIAASDGSLTIDRTTDPATYTGHGATTWEILFRCEYADGTHDEFTFVGGAVWLDASGEVAGGAIEGTYTVDDSARCGPEGVPPCTYAWSFTAN